MLKSLRIPTWTARWLAICVLTASPSFAGLNLYGGASSTTGAGTGGLSDPAFLGGCELTLNAFNVLEAGLFYDHNLGGSGSSNLLGGIARLGLGPLSGIFFDGKVGVTPIPFGVGGGIGLGYRLNDRFGLRAGPRLVAGGSSARVLADLAFMVYL